MLGPVQAVRLSFRLEAPMARIPMCRLRSEVGRNRVVRSRAMSARNVKNSAAIEIESETLATNIDIESLSSRHADIVLQM